MAITKITTASITDGTIATADIADSAISTAKIASGAVTSAKTTGVGGTNTPAFGAHGGGGNIQISNKNTWTLVNWGTEIYDSDNAFNGSRFNPQTAGKYLIHAMINVFSDGNLRTVTPALYINGTEYNPFRATSFSSDQSQYYVTSSAMSMVHTFNGSSDYAEIYVNINWGGTGNVYLNSKPTFGAIKIIE